MQTFPQGFTVLMAVYGGDDPVLFEAAVQSVLRNTLLPDAFILVVDGPVPRPMGEAVAKIECHPIAQVIRLAQNRGLATALNEGLKRVQTAWVVRADSDDINLAHRFERLAQAIASNPRLDLLGSAIVEVERNGQVLTSRRPPCTSDEIIRFARGRNPFNHMTVAYRHELAMRCGAYPHVYLKEDYALWASMLAQGAVVANVPDVLVKATAGRDMFRRRGGWRYARAEVDLQKHLVRCGIKGWALAIAHAVLRSAIFLAPMALREAVYLCWLRKPIP